VLLKGEYIQVLFKHTSKFMSENLPHMHTFVYFVSYVGYCDCPWQSIFENLGPGSLELKRSTYCKLGMATTDGGITWHLRLDAIKV